MDRENERIKEYALNLFVGKRIGRGAFRRVYAVDKYRVLKVEYTGREFCNMMEAKVWHYVRDTPLEDWFAPVLEIEPMGVAMLQSRTQPFDSEADFKKALEETRGGILPLFFDDVHYGNFGMLDGRVVCHDYGFNHFLKSAVSSYSEDPDFPKAEPEPKDDQLALPL
jgi:hypothetical protein